MNTPKTNPFSYSADVRIHLHINGHILPVAQLGPKFLILKTPVEHPPCVAEITMSIDGREKRWTVQLPDGIQVGCLETAISSCGTHGT